MTHGSSQHPEKRPDGSLTDPRDQQQRALGSAHFLHQLGTPLTVIRGEAQLIRRRSRTQGTDDAALLRSLTAIDAAVQRMITVLTEYSQDGTENTNDADRGGLRG